MAMITVKPGAGRLVRLPGGRRMPADGMPVEDNAMIRRWRRIGDVELVKTTAAKGTSKTSPSDAPTEEGLK